MMPRLHPRTLLRLAQLRHGVRALTSRAPPSAEVEWALDEAYALPFLSRGHGPDVASSSKLTLDSMLGVDPHTDRDRQARRVEEEEHDLPFASDADLVSALIPSRTALLPPSAAYLALRQSTLFGQHLQALLPRIAEIYATLRGAGEGAHNLLVSDLLLRNPSPPALRTILSTETSYHPLGPNALRTGLVVQAYRAIVSSLKARALAPLPPAALAVISRALMAAGHSHLDILDHVYYQLAHSSSWTHDDGWPALDILLHLSKHGRPEHALKLLDYPVSLGKLPAAMGRTTATHSEPATLMAQSAVARCALFWGLDVRAYRSVDDLVTTMSRTAVSGPAFELVLTAVRGAAARRRREDIAWAGKTLRALASDDAFPPLPNIDLYYAALKPLEALEFYASMPENRAAPPSPRHVLRMVLAGPSRPTFKRLASDLARTPLAAPAIPGILRALAAARMIFPAKKMYESWRAANFLDSSTTLAMVRALTRGARTAKHTELARTILTDCLSGPLSAEDKSAVALHAYALMGVDQSYEDQLIDREAGRSRRRESKTHAKEAASDGYLTSLLVSLINTRGPQVAQEHLDALVASHPSLAHRLAELARLYALEAPRAAVVLAANCAAGHWGALTAAGGPLRAHVFQASAEGQSGEEGAEAISTAKVALTHVETECIAALRKARQGRINAAAKRFATACQEDARIRSIDDPSSSGILAGLGLRDKSLGGEVDAVIPPTAAALLLRCAFLKRWDAGSSVLRSALSTMGAKVEDGVVDAAAVFVSALSRVQGPDVPDASDAYLKHREEVTALVARLEPASRVLLETMLENAGTTLGSPRPKEVEEVIEGDDRSEMLGLFV